MTFDRRKFLALAPAFPAAAVTATLVIREDGKIPVELGINVLNLQEGDTLVLTLQAPICAQTAERIRAMVEHTIPKVRALLLSDGLKIEGVLRQS